jgi:uncharacterized protein YndB with AHSA1/START domain
MSGPKEQPTADWAEREIVSTRLFDAHRERVFQACSDPSELQIWWGPSGFTNSFQAFDFRAGGVWRFVMHGPDGTAYSMDKVFSEIVRPERIVVQHLDPIHRHQLVMLFDEDAGKTQLTWRMQFEFAAEFARVKDVLPAANEQNLDRLAIHLGTMV